MKIPTRKEINPFGCLDGNCAEQHFYGLSRSEAYQVICDNAFYYCGDLLWMGAGGFVFYFGAVLDFLKSEHSDEESDFVSSALGILESRLFEEYNDRADIKSGVAEYIEFAEYTLANYERFDITESIYGDLKPRLIALIDKLQS